MCVGKVGESRQSELARAAGEGLLFGSRPEVLESDISDIFGHIRTYSDISPISDISDRRQTTLAQGVPSALVEGLPRTIIIPRPAEMSRLDADDLWGVSVD